MGRFPTPIVVISKCLGFAACRYDGETVEDDFVARLSRHTRVVPVCPEMEIGLGAPREKIRLVGSGPDQRLVQPATGRDLTATMRDFAAGYLGPLAAEGVDGFILKSRSPSCGIHDTKIFEGWETEDGDERGAGLFARAVAAAYPDLPVEDEARLADPEIRRVFLVRLFERAGGREGDGVPSGSEDLPYPMELL
jgi:uncharacterized protein YbbK (DUF523 family)